MTDNTVKGSAVRHYIGAMLAAWMTGELVKRTGIGLPPDVATGISDQAIVLGGVVLGGLASAAGALFRRFLVS